LLARRGSKNPAPGRFCSESEIALLALLPVVGAISVILVCCLPIWASVSIVLAAVVIVGIGGGELLAKALIIGVVLAVGVWLALRHTRRERT
jgi:hypothetical protein